MNVTIRPMTVDDAPRVGELHVRAWQAAYRGVMPDAYLEGLRAEERAEMWRAAVEADRADVGLDVIEADEQIAGFACYGPQHGGDDPSTGELVAINLDPDHWRLGLGRQLIRHVTSELGRMAYRRRRALGRAGERSSAPLLRDRRLVVRRRIGPNRHRADATVDEVRYSRARGW